MNGENLYIISKNILTDGMKKTLKVKELLESDNSISISKATSVVGISRTLFYKYKDCIYEMTPDISNIVCIKLLLQDKPGILSFVLTTISDSKANVLTINQEIPFDNTAKVSIYLETETMNIKIHQLINILNKLEGVIESKLTYGGK